MGKLHRLSDFKLVREKNEGAQVGGFYEDRRIEAFKVEYMIKNPYVSTADRVVMNNFSELISEFLAGPLYEHWMGVGIAPEIILIKNEEQTLLGSRILSHFATLRVVHDGFGLKLQCLSGGCDIHNGQITEKTYSEATRLEQFDVVGLEKAIAAMVLVRDWDQHWNNLGLVNRGGSFHVAKIDHGKSYLLPLKKPLSVTEIKKALLKSQAYYQPYNTKKLLQAMQEIVDSGLEKVTQQVRKRCEDFKEYLRVDELKVGFEQMVQSNKEGRAIEIPPDVDKIADIIIAELEQRINSYKKIIQQVSIEKAIIDNDVKSFQQLIKGNDDLDAPRDGLHNMEWIQVTPYMLAFELERKEMVEALVKEGVSTRHIGYQKAITCGLPRTAALHLDEFSSSETKSRLNDPDLNYLYNAAIQGQTRVLKFLLEKGANPNIEIDGMPLLHKIIKEMTSSDPRDHRYTVEKKIVGTLEALIFPRDDLGNPIKGADPRALDAFGNTILHHLVRKPELHDLWEFATKLDLNLGAKNHAGNTPLHYAYGGNVELIAKAQKEQRETEGVGAANESVFLIKNNVGNTPLHEAAAKGNTLLIEELVKYKEVDLEAKNDSGDTALHEAAKEGRIESVKAIAAVFNNVDAQNNEGCTALYYAAFDGHKEVAIELLKSGASVDFACKDGKTPLIAAATQNHHEIAKIFVHCGADVWKKDEKGSAAFDAAIKFGSWDTKRVLIESQQCVQKLCEADRSVFAYKNVTNVSEDFSVCEFSLLSNEDQVAHVENRKACWEEDFYLL